MSEAVQRRHTVSVAAVVIGECGGILAIRRRDNGAWQPPGGILEVDEEIEEGLRREVLEETGLQVLPVALTGIYKHIALGILSLVYRCQPGTGVPAQETDEATAITWMSLVDAEREMDEVFFVRVKDAVDYDLATQYSAPRVRHHDGATVLADRADERPLPGGADRTGGLEGTRDAVVVGLAVPGRQD